MITSKSVTVFLPHPVHTMIWASFNRYCHSSNQSIIIRLQYPQSIDYCQAAVPLSIDNQLTVDVSEVVLLHILAVVLIVSKFILFSNHFQYLNQC